jgi:hypothetical protein
VAVTVPLALLALWELCSRLAILSPRYFPPPTLVGWVLVDRFAAGDLGAETLITVTRLALAFAIAAVPGVPLGLLMGMARPVRDAVEPYIAFLFPVPKIALLPFLLILLGVGEPAFVLTGAISAFFQIVISTLVGVQNEAAKYWGVGLIRRIVRDEQQQRHVGIQLLTTTAIPVKISLSQTLSFTDADREMERAILLSTGPDSQGEMGVVMRGGLFNGRDSLHMTVRDKSFLLMPVSLVERGDDFDWAKFKIKQRAG